MLDNNLKQELLKAYNNVSKASKVEYNQQNLDDLVKLFHDNEYLSILFKLLSCFNQKITEGSIETADYKLMKDTLEYLKSEIQALKNKLDQQNKLISTYNGMYANRAKVAVGIRKPARIDGIEASTIRQYIKAGYSMNQIANKLGCSVSTLYRRLK